MISLSTYPPPSRESANPKLSAEARTIIIGAGPVGIHVARELLQRDPQLPLVMYGGEAWEPYNRVLLSELLAGEIEWEAIANPPAVNPKTCVELRINNPITAIDRISRCVIDSVGNRQHYSELVLATGSSPYVPALDNAHLLGVYTYRNVDDAQVLMTNALQSRVSIVLGGGALGIEVARALKKQNPETRLVLVHRGEYLMNRELDESAAQIVEKHIDEAGVEILLRETITKVIGNNEITGVLLASGKEIECDTLVLCTGIERNIKLARAAGLSVGRGIEVDDHMRTSDPSIYGVGECVEHRGEVYGLVAPGIDQAKVAAANILGENAVYAGSDHYVRLKLGTLPVCSIRRAHNRNVGARPTSYKYMSGPTFREVVLRRGRLIAATSVGNWPELELVHQAINEGRRLWPWQLWRFRETGDLWADQPAQNPEDWPDAAMACACMGVTCGALRRAVADGFNTVDALRECTGASQACGACRPLLVTLVERRKSRAPARERSAAIVGSLVSILLVLMLVAVPAPEIGKSVRDRAAFDALLLDPILRQVTGYAALALALGGLSMSARKRWRAFTKGTFEFWRVVHVWIGAATLGMLALHTGFRLGKQFNLGFVIAFLAVALAGAAAGLAAAGRTPRPLRRRRYNFLHVALFWLLPALTAVHILTVYYF